MMMLEGDYSGRNLKISGRWDLGMTEDGTIYDIRWNLKIIEEDGIFR